MRTSAFWGQALLVINALVVVAVQVSFVDFVRADPGDEKGAESTRTTAEVNLRAGPGLESEVLQVLPAGTEVLLVGLGEDGFVPVVFERQLGWVFAAYVGPIGVTSIAGVDLAQTTARVNLRSGPSSLAEPRGVVPFAATVALLGEAENGFVPVSHDGRRGYVAAEFVMTCDEIGAC